MEPQTQPPEPPTPPPYDQRPRFADEQFVPEYETAPPPDPRPPQALISLVIIMFLALSSTGTMIAASDTGTYAQVVVKSDSLSAKTIEQASDHIDDLITPTPTSGTPTPTPSPTTTSAIGPVPKKLTSPVPVPVRSTSPTPSPTPSKPASGYYDGTYTVNARYNVPGSTESIGVTLVLSNGVISDVSITQNATNGTSAYYQNQFAGGYKSQVVGKSIKSLSLGRVSGASLTPNGFNSAIGSIRSKAAA